MLISSMSSAKLIGIEQDCAGPDEPEKSTILSLLGCKKSKRKQRGPTIGLAHPLGAYP